MRRKVLIILMFICSVAGCVNIPDTVTVKGQYPEAVGLNAGLLCKALPPENSISPAAESAGKLDSRQFMLMNWNSHKGKQKGWQDDLVRLMLESDILTLQEGYLTPELQDIFQRHSFYWNIATAFHFRQVPTGVLTASRIRPDFLCSLRVPEQIGGIPKTVLVTRYPLAGSDVSLLLANVHMVNLSFESAVYARQLAQAAQILDQHRGPMIISGDFNSWSEGREALLLKFAEKLNLQAVRFQEDNRSLFLGHPVDYIFYRGLVQVQATTGSVTTSDHNPMWVSFSLNNEK